MASTSRYENAPIVVVDGVRSLGFRELIDTTASAADSYYTTRVGDTYQKIAWTFFGTAEYWWVLCDYNDVLDPFAALAPGTVLRVPPQAKVP